MRIEAFVFFLGVTTTKYYDQKWQVDVTLCASGEAKCGS